MINKPKGQRSGLMFLRLFRICNDLGPHSGGPFAEEMEDQALGWLDDPPDVVHPATSAGSVRSWSPETASFDGMEVTVRTCAPIPLALAQV